MENVMQFILDLFLTNGIVIAAAAFVVGAIIKAALDFIPNKYIPLICGVLGALLGLLLPDVFPDSPAVISAINGLILGWGATGGVETVKQLTKGA